jgi:hypothetical protein
MLAFPFSLILLPLAVATGVAYVTLGRLRSAGARRAGRTVLLAGTWAAPLFTHGPGIAQLLLGLLVGFLGIRMVALGARATPGPAHARAGVLAGPWSLVGRMLLPEPLLVRRAAPLRRPGWVAARGLLASAVCVGLLVAGNVVRLWHWSRFADDMLVFAEVALGAAGLHDVIVGVAALTGRQVQGLQDNPHLASSLTQFWGRRWNRLVQGNLDRAFFRPYARRRSFTLGTLLTFSASGIMHVVAVLDAGPPALTLGPAVLVMVFFLLHALLVLGERSGGVTRHADRPPGLFWRRLRTAVLFAILSPLLLDPFATVANVHGRTLGEPALRIPAGGP